VSIRIMSRVWDEADASGGALLVLLALANFADDDGICWPRIETVAHKARLTPRQVSSIITSLVQAGQIATKPGGGRGRPTQYLVLCGMSETEREQSLKKLRGLAKETMKESTKKLQGNEPETLKPRKYFTETAIAESGIATPDPHEIRHGGIHHDPPPPPATPSAGGGGGPENPSRHPAEDPETRTLLVSAGVRSSNALRRLGHLTPDIVRRFVAEAQASRNAGPGLLVSLLDTYVETGELPAAAPVQRVAPVANLLPEAPPLSAEERHRILARYGRAS
jgi:DNA-binding MarR family transcriptional regulator